MDSIDSRRLTIDGIEWQISVYADEDSTPFDADCYSPDDIEAWRKNLWCYVGIEVKSTVVGLDVAASVWGLEWHFPIHDGDGAVTDLDYFLREGECLSSLIGEARGEIRKVWRALSALLLIQA